MEFIKEKFKHSFENDENIAKQKGLCLSEGRGRKKDEK